MRRLGAAVTFAYSGASAIDSLQSTQPKIAFIDIGMPDMDGYKTGKETIFVALAGWGRIEDWERTSVAGFHHHLVKPTSVEDLRSLLLKYHPAAESEPK